MGFCNQLSDASGVLAHYQNIFLAVLKTLRMLFLEPANEMRDPR
jgi:hypothetical protein